MRVLIAPNEDGLGTAAWAVGLGRAFATMPAVRVRVVAVKASTAAFLARSLEGSGVEVSRLEGVEGWIELVKRRGAVDVPASRARLDRYSTYRTTYARAAAPYVAGADLVIEMGVPPLAASATVVTVLDHAWSVTMREIAGEHRALADIENDERRTRSVFLFPAPITGGEFERYWRGTGADVTVLTGVFGGGEPGIRKAVRRTLEIPSRARCVFVSGGGSGVWNGVLRRLVAASVNATDRYTVVHAPGEAAHHGLRMRKTQAAGGWSVAHCSLGRVIFIGHLHGATHSAITAAADLMVTRAGGGTVNDAIAHRVPLLLMDEPGHWQVERIRQQAEAAGIARTLPLTLFRRQPGRIAHLSRFSRERQRMASFATGGEHSLARLLVKQYGP
ncbi:MAG: glycosyltransferase [Bryobacteraceae bacterium]